MRSVFRKGLQSGMIILLAAGSLHVGAEDTYYRWMDERGNTVLSDRPPGGGKDYEVISDTSMPRPSVPAEKGMLPKKVEVEDEFQQVSKATGDEMAQNPETCAIARKNLETLNTFARVQVRDNDGVINYLGDEEKEAQRNEARALIQRHCN